MYSIQIFLLFLRYKTYMRMEKKVIQEIILQQQDFIRKIKLQRRDISIDTSGNYVFVGIRRAGKTYMLYQYIQQMLSEGRDIREILFVNFEDERIADMCKEELHTVIDAYRELFSHEPVVFLDEIQNIDGWEHFARRLADEGRGAEAVSIMVAGMTVANLFGVPLGTSLSHLLSWRVTFLLVGCWGLIILYYIWRWVPHVEGLKDTGFKGQFRFLRKPAPWLILGATALGNGGVFCWYSYINPMLTEVSGFSAESITPLMVLAGFGMVAGNLISGRLSDRFTPGRVGMVVQGLICVTLLLIFFLSPYPWCAALLMALCTAGLFAVSSPEQVLMIRVAPGGEMLGGAAVQMAFNLGNAVGAYVGGLAVSGGYRYPALSGVPFALVGFALFYVFYKKYQADYQE